MTQKDYKMPIIAGVLLILAVMVAPAWAASVEPLVYPDVANAECSDICEYYGLGDCVQVLKLENEKVANGDYDTPYGTITLSNMGYKADNGQEPVSFDWESEFGIWIVIVKDGVDGSNVYVYDSVPLPTEDDYLTTPNNGAKGISNIKFCIPVNNAPEFPTLAIPAALIIGMLGLVFVARRKNE
jgi:hypothetical protein